MASSQEITKILKSTPVLFRGPGGCIAVVKDGELLGKHVWGYADLDKRIAMTEKTLLPICSISKQMVCQILFSVVRDFPNQDDAWKRLDTELRKLLPEVYKTEDGKDLTIHDLCNMQSGIRDYWAMSALWGAKADDVFRLKEDAPKAVERTKSLHFPPGTEYSYCNENFYIIGRLVEQLSGTELGQLLEERLFKPAGMTTAKLRPDTLQLPGPVVGYEVDEQHGFFPAVNRMQWSGDAGVVASLEDMIAYEKHLQESWKDPNSLYSAISKEPTYKDGTAATYGYGLVNVRSGGKHFIGHSGMLRGFRLHRLHEPDGRLSLVVMLNHEIDAASVAKHILKQIFKDDEKDEHPSSNAENWKNSTGMYLDEATQLQVEVELGDPEEEEILITYAGGTAKLKANSQPSLPVQAGSEAMHASIDEGTLVVHCLRDNRILRAERIPKPKSSSNTTDFVGEYHCAEVESTFHLSGEDGMLYGSFDGYLGKSSIYLVRYLGGEICSLANPRGLDAPAPGDWTLNFTRDGSGKVNQVTIGCWLARKVVFVKKT